MAYTTNHTLLRRMREGGDESAWHSFRAFYSPLIATRGRDYRLNVNEIEQLIQNVLLAVHQEHVLTNYDPARGHFRDYLRTITSRQATRILEQRIPPARGMEEVPDEATLEKQWEEEWKKFLYDRALDEMKDNMDTKAYMAFELHAIQGRPADEVAKLLGLSPNQVYLIRSRGIVRLQNIIERLKRELE